MIPNDDDHTPAGRPNSRRRFLGDAASCIISAKQALPCAVTLDAGRWRARIAAFMRWKG